LDLGIAPNTKGLLSEEDIASLKGFGSIVKKSFENNIAKSANIHASNVRGAAYGINNLLDDDRYSYWASSDGVTSPELILEWKNEIEFDLIRLRENIKLGQRIEAVEVDVMVDGAWKKIGQATSIGACRIISFSEAIKTNKLRVRITSSPVCIALSDLGVFKKQL
jgi:alpha-L-fucosidase